MWLTLSSMYMSHMAETLSAYSTEPLYLYNWPHRPVFTSTTIHMNTASGCNINKWWELFGSIIILWFHHQISSQWLRDSIPWVTNWPPVLVTHRNPVRSRTTVVCPQKWAQSCCTDDAIKHNLSYLLANHLIAILDKKKILFLTPSNMEQFLRASM